MSIATSLRDCANKLKGLSDRRVILWTMILVNGISVFNTYMQKIDGVENFEENKIGLKPRLCIEPY
jgi:hypothetical protein